METTLEAAVHHMHEKGETFEVSVTKQLKDCELLARTSISSQGGHPALMAGIDNYIAKHIGEWDIKEGESIGFLQKGRQGYIPTGKTDRVLKTVEFYRIKDNL